MGEYVGSPHCLGWHQDVPALNITLWMSGFEGVVFTRSRDQDWSVRVEEAVPKSLGTFLCRAEPGQ